MTLPTDSGKSPRRAWPAWLEALRPAEEERRRLRAEILRRAGTLLDGRRLEPWYEVAAGWSRMLLPIAAVLVLFFAGLAYQAGRDVPPAQTLTLEELVGPEDPENALAILTSSSEPSSDRVLSFVVHGR